MNTKLLSLLKIVEEIAKSNALTCDDTEKLCKATACKHQKLCLMIRILRMELTPIPDLKREIRNVFAGDHTKSRDDKKKRITDFIECASNSPCLGTHGLDRCLRQVEGVKACADCPHKKKKADKKKKARS